MREAVQAAIEGADLLIMNAAVADFRPAELSERKIKKGDDEELVVRLVRNPDILAGLATQRNLIKVGFAAETQDLLEYARSKLERKGLDLIVANEAVASIGSEEIQAVLLDGEAVQELPRQPKQQAAAAIIAEVLRRWPERLGPRDEKE
jgi:phosphopantothenoylcysteine decarboxylase/phosphopantothenate--cysteine ligase